MADPRMIPGIGEEPPATPVPPRPAATLMLVRNGETGTRPMEVLMVRRNLKSDFVGGAHVFPGGTLDEADSSPSVAAWSAGLTKEEADRILGTDGDGIAYWIAAIRECFEEAGVLLAHRNTGDVLSLAADEEADRFAGHRDALNAGRASLLEICEAEDLRLDLGALRYFAHWITPEGGHRRYDTRFFVARAPDGQEPAHDNGETVGHVWVRPAEALRQAEEGTLDLIFPTIKNLEAIGRFATAEELLRAATAATSVPTILPKVIVEGRAFRILLPGDEGYEVAGDSA